MSFHFFPMKYYFMNFKRIKGYRYGYTQSININPPKLILHSMNYVKPIFFPMEMITLWITVESFHTNHQF